MFNHRAHVRLDWRASLAGGLIGSIAGMVLALVFVSPASADYTPGLLYPGVGPSGSYWEDHSVKLNQDGVDAWNYWEGVSVFSATTCVSNEACVMYLDEGGTVPGTSCSVPTDLDAWMQFVTQNPNVQSTAATFIATDEIYNNLDDYDADCNLGSANQPWYIIVVDDDESFGVDKTYHVQRHETAHALGLNEASTTCWQDYPWWFPLMNNGTFGTCGAYPSNYSATPNEIQAVWDRNDW